MKEIKKCLSQTKKPVASNLHEYLSSAVGGSWTPQSYPDELYPAEPTPEVIVTNGRVTAAIEVKRLTGDSIDQAYRESLLSNQKFLVPSYGGYYTLEPPVDFRLPMDINLRRHVKREIERLAPTLRPGEAGAVRVPRKGHISLISESGPPYIYIYIYILQSWWALLRSYAAIIGANRW